VQRDDLADDDLLVEKSRRFYSSFTTLHKIQRLKITNTRKDNLAAKRHEKHSQLEEHSTPVENMPPPTSQVLSHHVGPKILPSQEDEETQRVASISDLEKSSAGSKLFHACQEQITQNLGNLFCEQAIKALFHKNPPLDWVSGHPETPLLEWRSE
jgi:hypothetical protein